MVFCLKHNKDIIITIIIIIIIIIVIIIIIKLQVTYPIECQGK